MASNDGTRWRGRGVALLAPFIFGIVAVAMLGQLLPAEAETLPEGIARHTIDRGGTVRWNNGKTDVDMAFRFELERGPNQLPYTVGEWNGFEFGGDTSLLTVDQAQSIFPEVMVNRLYQRLSGDAAFFALVGSNTTRKLHRPEICYAAANWLVEPMPDRTIALESGALTINQFMATAPSGEKRLMTYSFVWGDARRRIEDGAFIMQVGATVLPTEGLEGAGRRLDTFLRQIVLRAAPPASLLAFRFGR